jgi:hypothetical protein
MINTLYFFLPGIIALGIFTSFDDIKESKIKNKYVIAALIYTILCYLFVIIYEFTFSIIYKIDFILNLRYLLEVFISIIISLIFGFGLYVAGLWTEGDAKLFLAYTAIIPLTTYSFGYIRFFPSFAIIINTFLPLLIFYLIKIIVTIIKEKNIHLIKKSFKLNNIFTLILMLFNFGWIFNLINRTINIQANILSLFVQYALIIVMIIYLKSIFKKNFIPLLIIVAILRLIIDTTIYNLTYLTSFTIVTIILILLNLIFNEMSEVLTLKKIKLIDLRKDMIIIRKTQHDKITKSNQLFLELIKTNYQNEINNINRINEIKITKTDLIFLHKINENKNIEFNVKQTIPFAPYIFGGVILTMLFQGSILNFLIKPIEYLTFNLIYIIITSILITTLSIIFYKLYAKSIYIKINRLNT